MRAVRGRTKKLIVAFHFHLFSNQAGWKCDACRKAGLDVKRRCLWLTAGRENRTQTDLSAAQSRFSPMAGSRLGTDSSVPGFCHRLPDADRGAERVVWARKGIATSTCPKSFITPQSLAWLEEFVVRRKLGQIWPENPGAREAEAFLILQAEWEAETQNG